MKAVMGLRAHGRPLAGAPHDGGRAGLGGKLTAQGGGNVMAGGKVGGGPGARTGRATRRRARDRQSGKKTETTVPGADRGSGSGGTGKGSTGKGQTDTGTGAGNKGRSGKGDETRETDGQLRTNAEGQDRV